nr:unnamed protein product [Naegleria fowleri]
MYSSSHQQPTTLSEKPSNPISGGDSSGASAPAQQPASSGLKHSTLKELEMEFSLLRVPLEMANREFRSSQKSVEKDLGILEKAVREMIQKATKQNVSAQDQSIFLDKVVTKLRGVKRKLEETDVLETNYLNNCRERLDHLEQYPVITGAVSRRKSISNITEHEYQLLTGWRRTRVNRVVVDYLLRFGHYETALALSEREHIKHLVDIEVFSRVKHVIESLMKKECSEALKWCSENRSRLRKISVRSSCC